jgi:hypothetical protein
MDKLVDGSLDSQPALMQVYVEALVVYSQAYRKAKQAQKEAETAKPVEAGNSSDGKTAAEKSASRRKSDAPDSTESTAAA